MLSRLRDTGLWRRLAAVGPGLFDSFVRDNKVLPPVLAVLALLIFSWVVAGIFLGEPEDEERVSNQANVVAQAPEQAQADGSESPAPEAQSRDAESYAAYESKDPFRQLFAPAGSGETTGPTDATTPDDGGGETTDDGTGGDTTGDRPNRPRNGGGQSQGAQDSDNDGLSDRRENRLGTDPQNPDTDADGTRDGADDDADGDGVTDAGGSGGAGGTGDSNGGANGGGGDGLFDSGGTLY